jgi:hypothetical protein
MKKITNLFFKIKNLFLLLTKKKIKDRYPVKRNKKKGVVRNVNDIEIIHLQSKLK